MWHVAWYNRLELIDTKTYIHSLSHPQFLFLFTRMALVSLFSSGALLFFGELYTSSNSGISKTRQSTVYSHRDDKGKLGAKQNRQQGFDSLDCVIGLFHAGSRVVLLLSSMRSEATCCLTENVFSLDASSCLHSCCAVFPWWKLSTLPLPLKKRLRDDTRPCKADRATWLHC